MANHTPFRAAAAILAFGAAGLAGPSALAAQDAPAPPYTLEQVTQMIGAGIRVARILEEVQRSCIAFPVDPAAVGALREASRGAGTSAGEVDELIAGLRGACRAGPAADAAGTPGVTLRLYGGASWPAPDATDFRNIGFELGGGVEFRVARRIQLGAELSYARFPLDGNELTSIDDPQYQGELEGGDSQAFAILATMRLNLPGYARVHPYIVVGAGYQAVRRDAIRSAPSGPARDEVDGGGAAGSAGGGIRFALGRRAGLFAESALAFGAGGTGTRSTFASVPFRFGLSVGF